MLCVCEGDDRRSRPGRGWRSEPAGVPAHYEENLPLLKEERTAGGFTCNAAHIFLKVQILIIVSCHTFSLKTRVLVTYYTQRK